MAIFRAAVRAAHGAFFALPALLALLVGGGAAAQDVTLTSRDGSVEISGNLLGFDGEFYRVDTIYGELTVDGSGVICEGPGCPDLEAYVAEVTLSGAPAVGRVLMPALIEAFAIRNGYRLSRRVLSARESVFALSGASAPSRVLGRITIRTGSSDEGFADLLAGEADIAMSQREVTPEEAGRAAAAGLGDFEARGRGRVIALDALVPIVAASNPVRAVSMTELAGVLSGRIGNWQALGGPDAPIALHVHAGASGIGQATERRVLAPAGLTLAGSAIRHPAGPELARAVAADPFALGVTGRSELGEARELAIRGECGFALHATRLAIKTEDYPLSAPVFLYLPARRFPRLVREFLSYLRDPAAQMVIRRAGFVDLAPEEIALAQQGDRLANAIARARGETGLADLQRMTAFLTPMARLTTTFRFEAGSARLDAQSRSNVHQLARALETGLYDGRRLVFVGFSDGQGPAEANLRIAQQRAEAVRDAVLAAAETASLERIALQIAAFGEAMPMACDDSAWGRQINRRVEVWIE
ncbi:MAG: phosphate ABC transporter substrate-binding/OmpA family protein [Roseovarius sp.]